MSRFKQESAAREGGLARFASAMPLRRGSGPITVLLVDDDDQVRGFCRSLLTANGFTVLEASNGLEALLTSVQHRGAIDLLLTDLEMPGISGMELGRAFNDLWPGVSVLYVSGSLRETVGDQLPADCAFLAKPFAPEALVDAIRSALDPVPLRTPLIAAPGTAAPEASRNIACDSSTKSLSEQRCAYGEEGRQGQVASTVPRPVTEDAGRGALSS